MGWQLVREAEDHGPGSLTWRERYMLSVLANAAMDSTRECPAGIEDRPEVMARLRVGRSELYAVLSALCGKGALVQLRRGGNGRTSLYGIARMVPDAAPGPVDNPVLGPGTPDPTHELGPGPASGNHGRYSRAGSGNDSELRPQNPGPTTGDTVFLRGDKSETRSTPAYPPPREAIRAAFPGLNDAEIDETIRVVKARLNPRDVGRYIARLISNGDLAQHIPCGLSDEKHSQRCRNRDCANCTASWCQGRCHGARKAGSETS
jgi:hypothetical protein